MVLISVMWLSRLDTDIGRLFVKIGHMRGGLAVFSLHKLLLAGWGLREHLADVLRVGLGIIRQRTC